MRDNIEIKIFGDDILCDNIVVARIINSSPSLLGDFKDWINEQSGNGGTQAYIDTLEIERDNLETENEELSDKLDCLITELKEAADEDDNTRSDEEKLKECRDILTEYSR